MPPSTPSGAPSPAQAAPATQKIQDIIGNLRPAKQFKFSKPDTTATSLSFDDTGELLLAALDDETLQLYNAREGRAEKMLLSKKYGCHLARFTHHAQSIIYASTKSDETIRYLSTHDNQYLRYFKGHSAPVTSLSLCPADDTFTSSSLDNTVRLWDLASPNAHGKLNLANPTLTAYDPTATVLAIASPATSSILLYDLRNYDKAPFTTFDMRDLDTLPHIASSRTGAHPQDWTCLSFSNDGKSLLLGTNSSTGHLLLDAFSGSLRAFLTRHPSYLPLKPLQQRLKHGNLPHGMAPASQGDVCLTPDAKYAVGASGGDKDAAVWDISVAPESDSQVLRPMAALPCKTRVGLTEWNPRFNMLASADKEVIMWLPEEHVGTKPPGDESKERRDEDRWYSRGREEATRVG